jgi:hypothetical protein
MGVAFGHLASFFHAFGVHDLQILHLPTTPPLPWHTRLRENFRALWYPARIAFLAGLFASGLLAVGGIAEGHGLWWALVFPTVWTLGAAIILLPGRRSLFVGLAMVGWIAVCLPLVLVVIAVALA